jgi:hypothetical protein
MGRLIRRIGCAILLLVIGAAAWHFRGHWMPKAKEIVTSRLPDATADGWEPLTKAGAQRTAERVQRLNRPTGPAYVNVTAADFASYVLGAALTRLAEVDSAPEALVDEGLLYLRTRIPLADLGGKAALGPLSSMFGDAEPLMIGGRLEPIRAGLAQYRLTEVALRDIKVPEAAISRLVTRWGPPTRPEGVSRDALPIELPAFIADLRLVNGRVTLYKTVQ